MLTLLHKPPPAPPGRDWYRDADPEDRREYDAFGPWVTEVCSEADMPRRFRPAWPRFRDARLVLKVPCGAERAQMRPGMDLYLTVLAIHDGGVSLMTWDGAAMSEREIAWDEIALVRNETNLLSGRWTILTRAGDAVAIAYNTVSSRIVDQATGLIRARFAWERLPEARPTPNAPVEIADHLYRYMATSMARIGPQPVVPVHFEPQNRWCRTERNRRRRTTGLLILDGPAELIVVSRNDPVKSLFTPNYSVVSQFLPHDRLTGYTVIAPPPDRMAGFHHLLLRTEGQVVDCACLAPPDAVVALLRARGVPER